MVRAFSRFSDATTDSREFEQAKLRPLVVAAVAVYFLAVFLRDRVLDDEELTVLAINAAALLLGLALFGWVIFRPGIRPLRRLLGILLDLSSATATMASAGEAGAILYLFYPWIVVDNGHRFGLAYLRFARALALAGFALVVFVSPFWREYPALDVALIVLLAGIPSYIGKLLTRRTPIETDLEAINVALVHHDADVRRDMALLFETWGCRCITAAMDEELKSKLAGRRLRPDALIVEYSLPGATNGLEVIDRLRRLFGGHLPVLLITDAPEPGLLARPHAGVSIAVEPVPPGKLRAFLSAIGR